MFAGLRTFIIAGIALLTLSLEARAEKRVALVIGNSAYQSVPQLPILPRTPLPSPRC